MTARKLVLKVHLILGLVAGGVLAVVCATGALLSFEHEIAHAMHPARYRVAAPAGAERLSLDALVGRVRAALPDAELGGVSLYADPARTVEVPLGRGETAYVDPYTGAVIERVAYKETGWYTVMALHRWLLGDDIGKLVVGCAVLAFLAILLTGVIVWWPKSRSQLAARTRITTRHGWVRFNYDTHVSLGIFCAVFLALMAFTGLMWSFKWFNAAMYAVAGSTEASREPAPAPRAGAAPASLDGVYAAAVAAEPSPYYRIALPRAPGAPYTVRVLPAHAANDYAGELLYVGPYDGEVVARKTAADHAGGQRLRWWFHALHFGTVGGWPTRIVWFVAALLGATFPITGALIWINRHRKRWRRRWRAWRGLDAPSA